MDIAALSMALSQQRVGLQAGIAVTKIAMDTSETNASLMTDMLKSIEHSVTPHLGSKIDVKL